MWICAALVVVALDDVPATGTASYILPALRYLRMMWMMMRGTDGHGNGSDRN